MALWSLKSGFYLIPDILLRRFLFYPVELTINNTCRAPCSSSILDFTWPRRYIISHNTEDAFVWLDVTMPNKFHFLHFWCHICVWCCEGNILGRNVMLESYLYNKLVRETPEYKRQKENVKESICNYLSKYHA